MEERRNIMGHPECAEFTRVEPPALDYDDPAAPGYYGLPKGSQERKDTPIFSGVMRYFPLALAAVARVSKAGNDKHNPGEPMHWARGKSDDHGDCLIRHQMEHDQIDPEVGEYHAAMVAWRALAQLQLLEEARASSPKATGIPDGCREMKPGEMAKLEDVLWHYGHPYLAE